MPKSLLILLFSLPLAIGAGLIGTFLALSAAGRATTGSEWLLVFGTLGILAGVIGALRMLALVAIAKATARLGERYGAPWLSRVAIAALFMAVVATITWPAGGVEGAATPHWTQMGVLLLPVLLIGAASLSSEPVAPEARAAASRFWFAAPLAIGAALYAGWLFLAA